MTNDDMALPPAEDRAGGLRPEPAAQSQPKALIPSAIRTKTLADVMADMSDLYEQVKSGDCDLRVASELSNITGKYLKAVQLDFAKDLWLERQVAHAPRIEQ